MIKRDGLYFQIARAIALSLMLGIGSFLCIFIGMVVYADHKYPKHNSMAELEAFMIGAAAGIAVTIVALCVALVYVFVRRSSDPNTPY